MKKNIKLEKNDKRNIEYHFDSYAPQRKNWIKKGKSFHKEDLLMVKELILPESNVLELGCGSGNLLAGLKPKNGIGIDLSSKLISIAKKDFPHLKFFKGNLCNIQELIKEKIRFDYIIMSDTIGYLDDVQTTLSGLHSLCNPNTRLLISYYSPLWSPILSFATFLGLKMPDVKTSYLNPSDIENFLNISNFETVRSEKKILLPFNIFQLL